MEYQDLSPFGQFDVTLIAKNGKEFKAHRHVLSEASPFFKNLLESDMKENKEGIVRLETLTELLMKEILEFIHTGDVQILSEENAAELIKAGDYLFLPNLKTVAGKFLERSMSTSNCISTYYFAKTYRCDELAARAETFVQSNFAIVAKSEEFLNLRSREVEEWISSDEIVINAEEDVFAIILGWIAKDRETRSGKFEELFRHVRIIFASRDFLLKELVTNNLVQQNGSCMNRVTQAVNWIDRSTYSEPPSPKSPRKIFESNVLVAYGKKKVACFFPDEDKWYVLPEKGAGDITACDGKMYSISHGFQKAEQYEPLSNKWTSIELSAGSDLGEITKYTDYNPVISILAANGEIYAVVGDRSNSNHQSQFLKYDLEANSWKFLPFSFLGRKFGVCAVPCNKHIYVVGGYVSRFFHHYLLSAANDAAARFDTVRETWEEIAAIQEARSNAFGAAANGKVYIAGGNGPGDRWLKSCEVYDEITNEWYFIGSLRIPRIEGSMVCVNDTLYVLGGRTANDLSLLSGEKWDTVEYYNSKRDKWCIRMHLPQSLCNNDDLFKACSARLFKGVSNVKSSEGRTCCII